MFTLNKIFKKELAGIKKNVSLAKYTTFKIGGKAKYFFEAKTKEDLIGAILLAKKMKLPFFILGGGSNLLVSDRGFNGLVIKIQNTKYKIQNTRVIYAEAGVKLKDLVKISLDRGLVGLEWAAGIPGTIGGAIRGNAAAFENSMAKVVKRVEVLALSEDGPLKARIFKNKDCKFSYRDSIFKKNPDLIILAAEICLKKGKKKEIKKNIEKFLNYRAENHPLNFPSAGSCFKNPSLSNLHKFATNFTNEIISDIRGRLVNIRDGTIPAGYLIEKSGLKGKKIGKAQISKKHANFIVNLGESSAKDVLKLINLAKKKVKEKFGIKLEEEICYLRFKN